MSLNHSEIIRKYSRQLRRTLLCDIAISTAYGFVGILLVATNFLNELVGRQILNPNQVWLFNNTSNSINLL